LEKKKEMLILSVLRNNSRASLTDISRQTKIPVSTIYDRLKTYHGKVIKKFTSIVDFPQIGYNAKAMVLLKVHREKVDELKLYLMNHKSVNNLMKINNGYNFLMEVVFKAIPELEDFLEKLECDYELVEKQAFYVIDDLRREDFMNSPNYLKILGF